MCTLPRWAIEGLVAPGVRAELDARDAEMRQAMAKARRAEFTVVEPDTDGATAPTSVPSVPKKA